MAWKLSCCTNVHLNGTLSGRFLLSGFWVCHLTYQQVIKWSNFWCKTLNQPAIVTRIAKKASNPSDRIWNGPVLNSIDFVPICVDTRFCHHMAKVESNTTKLLTFDRLQHKVMVLQTCKDSLQSFQMLLKGSWKDDDVIKIYETIL